MSGRAMAPGTRYRIDWLAREIEQIFGWTSGRLTIECVHEIMPGKTAVACSGEPEFTEEEEQQLERVLERLNAALGGRPVIRPGKA